MPLSHPTNFTIHAAFTEHGGAGLYGAVMRAVAGGRCEHAGKYLWLPEKIPKNREFSQCVEPVCQRNLDTLRSYLRKIGTPMDGNRSRAATLIGLAAAAGAFGVAAMMSAATAPVARADDYTEILNAVEGLVAEGQESFSQAATDFSGSDVIDGLQALINGVDDDLVGVPDDLYVGTVDALTTSSVQLPVGAFGITPPTDFADAVTVAEADFTSGEADLTTAAADLASGDYGYGSYLEAFGSIVAFDLPADQLLIGAVEALGF